MAIVITPRQLEQRAELYHQLGSLLSAGITLPQALEQLQRNPPSRDMRTPLSRLSDLLEQGQTFASSMHIVGNWTPAFDVALLQAGEQSGRLDVSFRLLADYYRERAAAIHELISRSLYSILLLHVAILVFPVSFLQRLVWNLEIKAFLFQKLVILLPLYTIVFLVLIACQGRQGEKWRAILEKISDRIPFIGQSRRQLALARLSAALEALINAGVSIFDAWELASVASGSPALKKIVFGWRPHLESGETPAQMLNTSPRFPEMFSNLYHAGEISGQQDETLGRLRVYYQNEGSRKTRQATRFYSGLLYATIALAIAYQVIQFWKNYFGALGNAINL
jgi:type II secretory pathway component PulF